MEPSVLDDQSLLADTPTGRLSVRLFAGRPWVVRHHPHDPTRPPQLVAEVTPEQGVLDALYGKSFWEQAAVRRAYAKLAETKDASAQRANDDLRRDTRREMRKYLWNHPDAGDRLRGIR